LREPELTIERLVLRVPGTERLDPRAFAADVARRLAEEMPDWSLRRVPAALDLRVEVAHGASASELALAVARSLARALR
jgi:hypothetical protein